VSSRLCIVVVVIVVIKRFVKVKKLFKKIALLSNNLVVVDIDNKKTTKLKLRINKLTISTFILFFISQTKSLFFTFANSIIVVFENNNKKKKEKKKKKRNNLINVVALAKVYIKNKNSRIVNNKKSNKYIKNIDNNNINIVSNILLLF